ncbi:MAG: hypothetical protein HY344_01960 [Candidatus Levybacteria bacterium]|nr:hypothetical protein [Candidatus Levybacteria bacterium]
MDEESVIEESSKKDRAEFIKRIFSRKNILFFLLFLILLNLLYLDLIIAKGANIKTIEKIISAPISNQPLNDNDAVCSNTCKILINEEIKKINKETPAIASSPTPTKAPSSTQTTSSVTKEYYIPFGSGSGSSLEWQDVSGLQASIDKSGYGSIKSAVFEVSLHIPTGNETASVRLYNSTDNHPVWNSEVTFNGNSSSVSMSSNPITLDSGNKLYKVQIKTQLQYSAVIDQSRVHIITN